VLDGHSAATLAITRSLGRAKHWVAVGSNQGIKASAELSPYCRLSTRYPVPYEDASGFVETVLEFARKNEIKLIILVTDFTIIPLSKNRHRFQECPVWLWVRTRRSNSLPISSGPSVWRASYESLGRRRCWFPRPTTCAAPPQSGIVFRPISEITATIEKSYYPFVIADVFRIATMKPDGG
jgi:hypothetical protein